MVETLGITIVSGDQWRDEEVAHTLRMLEIIGRTDVPVYPGAVFPLINRLETIERWETIYGKVAYKGAWNRKSTGDGVRGVFHGSITRYRTWSKAIPPQNPRTKTLRISSSAWSTNIRMKLRFMPGDRSPTWPWPLPSIRRSPSWRRNWSSWAAALRRLFPIEWQTENRREFNFWWDPEAVHMVLTSPWHKITITTVDISVKTRLYSRHDRGNRKVVQSRPRSTSASMVMKNICGMNWPPRPGSIPASSPRKPRSTWTSISRTRGAMETCWSGRRVHSPVSASNWSTSSRIWIRKSSTACSSTWYHRLRPARNGVGMKTRDSKTRLRLKGANVRRPAPSSFARPAFSRFAADCRLLVPREARPGEIPGSRLAG